MFLSVANRSSAKALRHVRSYAATTHAVSSDGTRIAYTTTAGGGTPTLLINGWAGCAADWGSLVDRLGGSGRRVVAFDPRGFGASGFVNTEDATQLAALAGSFDVILLTASGHAKLTDFGAARPMAAHPAAAARDRAGRAGGGRGRGAVARGRTGPARAA